MSFKFSGDLIASAVTLCSSTSTLEIIVKYVFPIKDGNLGGLEGTK